MDKININKQINTLNKKINDLEILINSLNNKSNIENSNKISQLEVICNNLSEYVFSKPPKINLEEELNLDNYDGVKNKLYVDLYNELSGKLNNIVNDIKIVINDKIKDWTNDIYEEIKKEQLLKIQNQTENLVNVIIEDKLHRSNLFDIESEFNKKINSIESDLMKKQELTKNNYLKQFNNQSTNLNNEFVGMNNTIINTKNSIEELINLINESFSITTGHDIKLVGDKINSVGNYKIINKTFGKYTILTIPEINIVCNNLNEFDIINIENIFFAPYNKQMFQINIKCIHPIANKNKIITTDIIFLEDGNININLNQDIKQYNNIIIEMIDYKYINKNFYLI